MKSSIQIKKIAQEVINIEQKQIENLVDRIDENFTQAIKLISSCKGRLIVAGFIHIHDIINEGIVK